MESQKYDFLFKEGRNLILTCILACAEVLKVPWLYHYQSYTVVIDTSMERFSRELQHEKLRILKFDFL